MATQTSTRPEQNQGQQGQPMTRGSQQGSQQRRGGLALGMPLTTSEFFRMNPFSLMRRMTEELDRTFGDVNASEQDRAWAPVIEVTQREGNYIVRAELAGVNPDDVTLEIADDMIVISGERKMERDETRGGVHVSERRYGRFYRAIPLPENANVDQARARYENGVLEVIVPSEEPRSKRREIPIGSQASSPAEGSGTSSGQAGSTSPGQGTGTQTGQQSGSSEPAGSAGRSA